MTAAPAVTPLITSAATATPAPTRPLPRPVGKGSAPTRPTHPAHPTRPAPSRPEPSGPRTPNTRSGTACTSRPRPDAGSRASGKALEPRPRQPSGRQRGKNSSRIRGAMPPPSSRRPQRFSAATGPWTTWRGGPLPTCSKHWLAARAWPCASWGPSPAAPAPGRAASTPRSLCRATARPPSCSMTAHGFGPRRPFWFFIVAGGSCRHSKSAEPGTGSARPHRSAVSASASSWRRAAEPGWRSARPHPQRPWRVPPPPVSSTSSMNSMSPRLPRCPPHSRRSPTSSMWRCRPPRGPSRSPAGSWTPGRWTPGRRHPRSRSRPLRP